MKSDIDNFREAMGTAPSSSPMKKTLFVRGCEMLDVEIVDCNKNPYKAIVEGACATWGDDKYESKWNKITPENRFRVVLAALTGNTLPQALESVKFTFRVKGTPRHCFDQHARARIDTAFFSIGSRDNNKLDSSMILYTKLFDRISDDVRDHLLATKELYEKLITEGQGSWQTARAILPMCYHHPYCFTQGYLALQGQCARRMMFCEEETIAGLHWLLRHKIAEMFPLLAEYLRPACDNAKKCVYAKSYTLSNAFGCLFAGCGRWEAGTEYSTFNESCSDICEIEKQLGFHIRRPTEWINYTENDYSKLSELDKKLFEEE